MHPRVLAAALSGAASAHLVTGSSCAELAAAPDSSSTERVALFSGPWGRFMPRVSAQLKSKWRLVEDAAGAEGAISVVVGGGGDEGALFAALPALELLQVKAPGVKS